MEDKRRVCCFCEKWGSGGIESFLLGTWEAMDRQDLEIRLVTAQVDSGLLLPRLDRLGIGMMCLSGRTRQLFKNHAAFRRLLEREHFDAVHLNVYHGLSCWYARDCRRAGVPVILLHGHGSSLRQSVTRPLKLVLHRLCRRLFDSGATGRLACSRAAARFQFPESSPVTILHNGIDLEVFSFSQGKREELRRELGLGDKLAVGTVGRLEREKNQLFLLEVFAELLKAHPNSVLLLAGEGEDRPALEQTAARLGMEEKVLFLGARDDIPALLSALDVFVLPSRFEGLGIAAIEAQAAGLPAVLSTGVPEETAVCPQVLRLPLHLGPKAWAEAIWSQSCLGRQETPAPALAAAGFDRQETARVLRAWYLGEDGEECR